MCDQFQDIRSSGAATPRLQIECTQLPPIEPIAGMKNVLSCKRCCNVLGFTMRFVISAAWQVWCEVGHYILGGSSEIESLVRL